MKIFVPSKKDKNPYFDELIQFSENNFTFGHFSDFTPEYSIVNVHFPEAIFDWQEPGEDELEALESQIRIWKESAKLVYTRHDAHRLLGETPRFNQLFRLIEKNADAIIHLGEHSKNELVKIYPDTAHKIIPHPLYENSFQRIERSVAREKLKIPKDAFVVVAAGRIRNKQERKMLIRAFTSLPVAKKILLSNNMLPFKIHLEFPGRIKLKKLIDINKVLTRYVSNKYRPPKYLFEYSFSSSDHLSLMMSASDIVFIPRIDILNSGNLFLGLTFEKIVVGPAVGNLKEHLDEFSFPQFDPQSRKSVKEAIMKGYQLHNAESFRLKRQAVQRYKSDLVFKQLDEFLSCLTK